LERGACVIGGAVPTAGAAAAEEGLVGSSREENE
jgi:hypothetical protein